ncbi:MAG: type IV pilus secretin PilQ [Candidatus Tectimicrobiota bacterium]
MNLSHRLSGVFIGILTVALVCGGCGVNPPAVVSQLPPVRQDASPRAVLTGITTEALHEKVRIAVQSTEAVEYTTFTLQDPARLVVTFPNATLGAMAQPLVGAGVVQSLEASALPEEQAVRLVVYLQHMVPHTVELQGRQLLLTLADPKGALAETVSQVSPTPGGTSAGTTITGIAVESQAERAVVKLQTSGVVPTVQVKQLQQPPRLALEIKPAQLSPRQEPVVNVRDPVGMVTQVEAIPVTAGQESAVKILVHLRLAGTFAVQQENDVIRLAVTPPATETLARRSPVPVGQPLPTSASPALSNRPALLPQPGGVPSRVAQVSPLVRVRSAPTAPAAPDAASAAAPPKAPDLPPEEGVNQTPLYTGEKISLDFQDADINDILRLIAEVGGVNIIAGGDVQGKVTTRMVDVPWDQALDVILKINGLAQERSGNIIRVGPLEKFTVERQERLKARVTEVQAEPVMTQIVPINFAAAKDLRANLEKLLSNRGTIFIDNRTNTMIVTDTRQHLDEIFSLVDKLDRPTPQVMIEARIVESSRSFMKELGVQLGLAYSQITDRAFPNRIDVRGGIPTASGGGGLTIPPAPANFLLDLPAAVASGSGGAIGFSLASIGGAVLDAQLSALESSGKGKIISSPRIATLDNIEAEIKSGRRIPYRTLSAEGTKTEFIDAAITLKVTPRVTPNDYIGMKILAAKNEVGETTPDGPIIITREANTDMLVKDGDTVVIAGLYTRTIQSSRAGIPGLSSLPVIGALFRKESEQDRSDELLIFLTPRIIRQDDTPGKRRTALSN